MLLTFFASSYISLKQVLSICVFNNFLQKFCTKSLFFESHETFPKVCGFYLQGWKGKLANRNLGPKKKLINEHFSCSLVLLRPNYMVNGNIHSET